MALFKRSDKFSNFVIKFFSTFNPQSNGKSSQIESGNHIVKFRIHLNWDDRFGGCNPVGHALKKEKIVKTKYSHMKNKKEKTRENQIYFTFKSNTQLFKLFRSVNRCRGRKHNFGLLDQWINQTENRKRKYIKICFFFRFSLKLILKNLPGLFWQANNWADLRGHSEILIGQGKQSRIDHFQYFHVTFNPSSGGNLLEDGYGGIELDQDIEGSDPHFSSLKIFLKIS